MAWRGAGCAQRAAQRGRTRQRLERGAWPRGARGAARGRGARAAARTHLHSEAFRLLRTGAVGASAGCAGGHARPGRTRESAPLPGAQRRAAAATTRAGCAHRAVGRGGGCCGGCAARAARSARRCSPQRHSSEARLLRRRVGVAAASRRARRLGVVTPRRPPSRGASQRRRRSGGDGVAPRRRALPQRARAGAGRRRCERHAAAGVAQLRRAGDSRCTQRAHARSWCTRRAEPCGGHVAATALAANAGGGAQAGTRAAAWVLLVVHTRLREGAARRTACQAMMTWLMPRICHASCERAAPRSMEASQLRAAAAAYQQRTASGRLASVASLPAAPAPAARRQAGLRLAAPPPRARGAGVARAVSGAKDRGEWTRFLDWTADDSARASVSVELLAGGAAAEVTVEAPDRPGLLSDITSTIASLGLTIDKARARPLPGRRQGPPMPPPPRRAAPRLPAASPRRRRRAARQPPRRSRRPSDVSRALRPAVALSILSSNLLVATSGSRARARRPAGARHHAGQQGQGRVPGVRQERRRAHGGAHVLHPHCNHQRREQERRAQGVHRAGAARLRARRRSARRALRACGAAVAARGAACAPACAAFRCGAVTRRLPRRRRAA
jgi:hypothetical protein